MRKKYGFLLLFPLILSSCWWFGTKRTDPLPSYPIAGKKWQEVKLWVYHKTYDGFIFIDTTYQRSAFDTLNYVQFFNDGSLNIASDVYYPFNVSGKLTQPPTQYESYKYYFIPWRSSYLINQTAFHADTVFYNGRDSLRIHSFYNNNQALYYDEVDAYYTR